MPKFSPLQSIALFYTGDNLSQVTGEPAALASQDKAALDSEILFIRQSAARTAGDPIVSKLSDPLDLRTRRVLECGDPDTRSFVRSMKWEMGNAWIESLIRPAPAPRSVAAAVPVPRPAAPAPAPARAALPVPVVPPPAPAPPSPVLSGLERAAAAINARFSRK